MTEYRCLTIGADGKTSWQRLNANDEAACIEQLVRQNVTPLQITSGSMGLAERLNQPISFKIVSSAANALEMRQMATLVKAGLPIDRSLDLLRDQMADKRQRNRFAAMLQTVRNGDGLADAMTGVGGYPKWSIGIVRAAQASGHMADALSAIAERMEREQSVRSRLITALTYPAAVMIATVAALIIVLTVVVPQFAPVFAGEEDKLPGLTLAVLWLSKSADNYAFLAFFIISGLAIFVIFALRFADLSTKQKIKRFLPAMGLRNQYIAAQYTGLLATLILNGVKAVRALALARDGLSSASWISEMEEVEVKVRQGVRLSDALVQSRLFPTTAARLVEVGERTGNLGETLLQASNIMGEAVNARIERVVSLVNPLAIIILGALVALLVAGVMLGIFSLGEFAG